MDALPLKFSVRNDEYTSETIPIPFCVFRESQKTEFSAKVPIMSPHEDFLLPLFLHVRY